MTKAPGFFETGRNLFAGSTGSVIQSLRLLEEGAQTARLGLISTQVELVVEAKASLNEAGMSLQEFQASKEALLA